MPPTWAITRDVRTGIAARRRDGQALEVMRPTLAVIVNRVGRKAAVHEANARLVTLGVQRDLHRRGSGRDRVVLLAPNRR